MKNKLWVIAVILSAVLTTLIGLLTSVVANYLTPISILANNPWLVYSALFLVFIFFIPLNIYLAKRALPDNTETQEESPINKITPQPSTSNKDPFPSSFSPSVQLPSKSFHTLIGRDALIGDVMAALRDPGSKWMVTIDGMGGIGKTALARETADRCLKEGLFETIVWEQAPREQYTGKKRRKETGTFTYETTLDAIARQLGALDVPLLKGAEKEARVQTLLQSQRVLVVLDNLETAKEPQNEIARKLRPLLAPSKALLTSRQRFQGDLYPVSLIGLKDDDSITLIRRVAEERNISRVAAAELSELQEIAETTGGSPLALKLVVGQLANLPLGIVLSQLREIQPPTQNSEEDEYYRFYQDIFFPSWRLLTDDGKKLLISMSHFAPGVGGTLEAINATSGLADNQLIQTINELWRFSFLEVGESSNLKQIRYYLHALTQYFVLSDIVKVLE